MSKAMARYLDEQILSNKIYVKLIQQTDLSAKLWQAVSAVNEAEHTAIKLSKAITATKIEYKMV